MRDCLWNGVQFQSYLNYVKNRDSNPDPYQSKIPKSGKKEKTHHNISIERRSQRHPARGTIEVHTKNYGRFLSGADRITGAPLEIKGYG